MTIDSIELCAVRGVDREQIATYDPTAPEYDALLTARRWDVLVLGGRVLRVFGRTLTFDEIGVTLSLHVEVKQDVNPPAVAEAAA